MRNPEDKGSCVGMDVLPVFEGLEQLGVFAKMGQKAEFDLRVIPAEEEPALFLRFESCADLKALGGPDGDVLEVRVLAGKPSGSGSRLIECAVDAAGVWIDRGGKGVCIGRSELFEDAVVENLSYDRVFRGELF